MNGVYFIFFSSSFQHISIFKMYYLLYTFLSWKMKIRRNEVKCKMHECPCYMRENTDENKLVIFSNFLHFCHFPSLKNGTEMKKYIIMTKTWILVSNFKLSLLKLMCIFPSWSLFCQLPWNPLSLTILSRLWLKSEPISTTPSVCPRYFPFPQPRSTSTPPGATLYNIKERLRFFGW